jgi:hypothetical protein
VSFVGVRRDNRLGSYLAVTVLKIPSCRHRRAPVVELVLDVVGTQGYGSAIPVRWAHPARTRCAWKVDGDLDGRARLMASEIVPG